MISHRYKILFIIIFIPSFYLWPQASLNFEVALTEVSSQIEGNMIRDEEGFLWFCYYGGVARYDGYKVKYYESGENSLSGPASISIAMDDDGIIWILTKDNGLNKYDKDTDSFTHYLHDPDNENSISSNLSDSFGSHRLFVDDKNRLLIGTMGGFDIYDKKTEIFTHYSHNPDNENSLSSNNVTSIIQDSMGMIWIGTGGNGLNRFDEKTNTCTRFYSQPNSEKGPVGNIIWSLLEDSRGEIWVGTWDSGLSRYNRLSNSFTHYTYNPENAKGLGDNKIFYLYEDSSNNVIICHRDSDVAGFEIYDRETDGFIRYRSTEENASSINSNFISSVFEDPETGILWALNTHSGVIDKFDKKSLKFNLESPNPNNPDSISSSLIVVMLEDSIGNLWISTGDSLNYYNKKTKVFTSYPYNEIDPIMGPFTSAMCWENENQMWLLSNRGVLTLFDTRTLQPVKIFKHDPENINSIMISTSAGGHIIKDKNNPDILWMGLYSGVEKFNTRSEVFTHYTYHAYSTSITQGTVWSVYDDGKGFLWVSAFGGLCILDKENESVISYLPDPEIPGTIGFTKQSTVFEDSFGNMWIAGFENGMDLFDRETETFFHFNKETGFPASGINLTIQEDSSGNLWIGTTDNGLIKFNINNKEVLSVFSKDDGLQDNHFWRSFKMSDGQMWFGGGYGVNHFYPEQVTLNDYIPPVFLTSFTQGGNEVHLGMAPERLAEVTLGWQENYFEFQFAGLNYTKPEKNRFAYMLEGRDRDWYYSDEYPSGRYTGLSGGSYRLRLKASNNDGIWNEEGYSLEITVKSPFWKTKLFIALIVLIFLIIISLIIHYVSRLLKEIRNRKESDAKLRQLQYYLSNIIDSMPSILIAIDNDCFVTQWNKTAEEKTGISTEAAYGKYITELIPSMNSEMHKIKESINSKQVRQSLKNVRKLENNKYFEDVTVYPLTAEGMEGAVVRIDDVTEQVKLEEMMIQNEKILSIGGLAAGMAHEINNPLAGMLQTAEVMGKRLGQKIDMKANILAADEVGTSIETIKNFMGKRGIHRMINSINESGNRIAVIIHNMLSFARQNQREVYSHNMIDVMDKTIMLASTDYDIKKHYDFKKIRIIKEYSNILPHIPINESKIQQVLLNILKNGAHAMEEANIKDPHFIVRLLFNNGDRKVRIEIEDNGPGMDEKTRKNVFEPFFTTKPPGIGTGLGLSVSYFIIAENHKGEMTVESQLGKGCKFIISLPVS